MKGYVIDTFFKQSLLNPQVCFGEIQTPQFPGWVTRPHQSAVNIMKLNFSANVCHLQQSVEMPNMLHKLAAQTHELGLPVLSWNRNLQNLDYVYFINALYYFVYYMYILPWKKRD